MVIKNPNMSDIPGNIRDPMIFTWDGKYYLVATSPDFWGGPTPGVRLWSSADLVDWKFEKVILPSESIPDNCNCKSLFWAPEIFCHGGKFYLTVNGKNPAINEDVHSYLAVSDCITGPYTIFRDPISDLENSNDANLFADDDGKVYLSCNITSDRISAIMITEFDLEKGHTVGEPVPAVRPGAEGEWDHHRIIEGAFLLKRGGLYYLWYSGLGRGYEMGLAVSDSLKHEFTKNLPEPAMSGLGTDLPYAGHNCAFRLMDGRDAIAFHASGPNDQERLCIELVSYPASPQKIHNQIEI